MYMMVNRNKRGMQLNLKEEKELNILYKLVKSADVFALSKSR
jgi:crotonobetainyl-CoA:carnitine CoA-transferase CaiB-like acyl-CoA transferase